MADNDFTGPLAAHEFTGALVANWPDVLRFTPADDLPLLANWIITARDAAINGQPSTYAAVDEVRYLLDCWLPDEHPVRAVMPDAGYAYVATRDLSRMAGHLAALPLPVPVSAPAPARPAQPAGRAEVAEDFHQRLLSAPSYTESEAREAGIQAGRRDLIRLPVSASTTAILSFQFGPDHQPIGVVTEINRLLDAAEDPWGVADWWLSENVWLRAIPAQSLGRVADVYLIEAAQAILPEREDVFPAEAVADSVEPGSSPGTAAEPGRE
jgi:hypothetical protein